MSTLISWRPVANNRSQQRQYFSELLGLSESVAQRWRAWNDVLGSISSTTIPALPLQSLKTNFSHFPVFVLIDSLFPAHIKVRCMPSMGCLCSWPISTPWAPSLLTMPVLPRNIEWRKQKREVQLTQDLRNQRPQTRQPQIERECSVPLAIDGGAREEKNRKRKKQ